jgi:hypothetical protein
MPLPRRLAALALPIAMLVAAPRGPSAAEPASLPPIGGWDGKTASAALDGPYEDPVQNPPPFGIVSYFNHPWRGYMDTWPASQWTDFVGASFTLNDHARLRPVTKLLTECGVRFTRVEIGWGSLGWDDDLPAGTKDHWRKSFAIFKEHGVRPVMLLNAHHGMPCPHKDIPVEIVAPGKKGDRTIRLKAGTTLRTGFTGLVGVGDYKAMCPIVTTLDPDGTAHLSKPLPADVKAGATRLIELKYLPFQGVKLKDGTPVPEALESVEGWKRYALAIGRFARECLGTEQDAGFDIEVWNELTFGSDFLDINHYFEPKREYAEPFVYRKTRAWTPALRPDARLAFEDKGWHALLPVTVDLVNDPANGFKGVKVVSGFSNQWPWNSGASRWDGQAGISRHYYTGSTGADFSPETPVTTTKAHATVNALGALDGTRPPDAKEWWQILPGTNLIPRFRASLPEWCHFGWKTECISRDIVPDSRRANAAGFMGRYGRYTTNGELAKCLFWQTEVNFDRRWFIDRVIKETGAKEDDPRLVALNDHTNSKHILRQYAIHGHKGLDRIWLFSADFNDYEIGLLPKHFYTALDAAKGELTDEVRARVPKGWWGVRWLSRLMREGQPLPATRALRVDALVEHKPRLVFAGEGTRERPHKWNRDVFAVLPYQLTPARYAVAYYVVFPDAFHAWDPSKGPLDPARYDMPEQEFDVTLGNVRGTGAKAVARDLLADRDVPVTVVDATPTTLTVRVRATDCPRVLVIDEARPGPVILEPRAAAAWKGEVAVTWKTNVPPQKARVTFGRDWEFRGATAVDVAPAGTAFSVKLPVGPLDMAAVRIRVEADGLACEWPRWDEDVAGQVVMPDAKPRPADQPPAGLPDPLARASGPASPLEAPKGADLPVELANPARGAALRLPRGAAPSGPADDRTVLLAAGGKAVELRVRYLPGAAARAADHLPVTSTIDPVTARAVTLPGGAAAVLLDYTLDPVARPGATNLRQRFLAVKAGAKQADLLLVGAVGTPEAMTALEPLVTAVFAGVTLK